MIVAPDPRPNRPNVKGPRQNDETVLVPISHSPRKTPTDPPGHSRVERKPLAERVADIQRKKAENLLHKRMEVETEQNATFKPAISSRSERIVHRKREEAVREVATGHGSRAAGRQANELAPAGERLYNLAKQKKAKSSGGSQERNKGPGGAPPATAPKTQAIVENSVFFQGPCADFIVRQQTFEDARNQRRELRRKIAEGDMK